MKIELVIEAKNVLDFTPAGGSPVRFLRYRCKSTDAKDSEIYCLQNKEDYQIGNKVLIDISSSKSTFPGITQISGISIAK